MANSQYRVQFKQVSGFAWLEGVVPAGSPRLAVTEFCRVHNRLVTNVVKYGSWRELQQAFVSSGNNCELCEVTRVGSDRPNYYVVYVS